MIKFIKSIYNNMSETGIKFPFAYDAISKKPSVTLFFAYITFILMVVSLVLLHLTKVLLQATATSILVWVIAVVFYRLRELDKFKINLKDQSIDLEDTPDNKEKEEDK